jgi:hypothetical protein
MKRITLITLAVILTITSFIGASAVMAAKPINVIDWSNGFPSGQHFNLNLHGRDPATYTGTPNGNAVVIALTGNSTIQYLSNKKNRNNTELTVLDSLAENFAPDYDPAQVYLPYNIFDESDNTTKSAEGYYVYGRILGPPNKGSDGPSKILLTQNFVVAAANATDNTTDGWPFPPFDPDDDLLGLGLVTTQGNLYVPTADGSFERFDPPTDDPNQKGKGQKTGKSMGVEITDLFTWTGWVSDNASLDMNNNGYLDPGDVPQDWIDINCDPIGNLACFELWLTEVGAIKHTEAWIFDIADMVISGQTIISDGTKNFQIRFYPVVTTEFGDPKPG